MEETNSKIPAIAASNPKVRDLRALTDLQWGNGHIGTRA